MLYTAGCIGLEAGFTPAQFNADLTIEEQTRIALVNLQQVLKEAKCSINDVVKTTVFLADINDAKAMEADVIRSEEDAQKAYEEFVKDTNGSIDAKSKDMYAISRLTEFIKEAGILKFTSKCD